MKYFKYVFILFFVGSLLGATNSFDVIKVNQVLVATKLKGGTLIYPLVDGAAGYVMTTDGANNLTLQPAAGGNASTNTVGNQTWIAAQTNIFLGPVKIGNLIYLTDSISNTVTGAAITIK